MNVFYVIALIALVLAVIALFVAWPLYPFLIAALASGVVGFFYDRSGGRRW